MTERDTIPPQVRISPSPPSSLGQAPVQRITWSKQPITRSSHSTAPKPQIEKELLSSDIRFFLRPGFGDEDWQDVMTRQNRHLSGIIPEGDMFMKRSVQEKDIKCLLHFTRYSNLSRILAEGLIPREELETREISGVFNDELRLDGHRNASCLSIGHPNYKMFYSLRRQFPNEKWVVLAIKRSVLWEKDCAFCIENAASSNVTRIPLVQRKGLHAFNAMFDEIEGKPPRATLGIPAKCPTNPQAEVLVFDTIEPNYILGAICSSPKIKAECEEQFPDFQFLHSPGFFSARADHSHW